MFFNMVMKKFIDINVLLRKTFRIPIDVFSKKSKYLFYGLAKA